MRYRTQERMEAALVVCICLSTTGAGIGLLLFGVAMLLNGRL